MIEEKFVKTGENQITAYEISDGEIVLQYLFEGQNKSLTVNFEMFSEDEKSFIKNSVKKNPILKEDFVNSKLNYYFFLYLNSHNIPIPLEEDIYTLFAPVENEKEKEFLALTFAVLIKQDPLLILDVKGFETDDFREELAKELLHVEKASVDYIDIDKVTVASSERQEPEYFRLKKLYSDEIFVNFPENPKHFEKKDFKSHLIEIYDLIRDEFDNVFGYESNFFARNCDFYCQFGKKDFTFFVSPTINFEIYLKSKGSMYRINKELSNVPVIEEDKLFIKKLTGLVVPKYIIYDYFLSFQSLIENDSISHSTRFYNYLTLLAKDIVQTLNFRPSIRTNPDNTFSVYYSVDFENPKLKLLLTSIINYASENFGYNPNTMQLVPKSQIKELLNDIINYMIYKILSLKAAKLKSNATAAMFIQNLPIKAVKNNKNYAIAIKEWLNCFNITQNPVKLMLTFDKDGEFDYKAMLSFNYQGEMLEIKKIFEREFEDNIALRISSQLTSASEYMPALSDIFASFGVYRPALNAIDIIKNLSKICSSLNDFNIDVFMPSELNSILRPKLSIKSKLKSTAKSDFINSLGSGASDIMYSLNDIMDFSYEISIGDEKLSKEEFLNLIKNSDELIKFKDKFVLLNEEQIKKILENLDKPIDKKLNKLELIHSVFSNEIDDFELNFEDAIRDAVKAHLNISEITTPQELNDVLRPYQQYGFKWLYSNISKGFGCCIADDMGLGKTVQILALVAKLKQDGLLTKPALVVCPTTLVGNWKKEVEKFTPSLQTSIYHGLNRRLDLKTDIIITTYGHLRIDLNDIKKHDWGMLIIDEAQSIKNPSTAQAKAIKSISTVCKIAVTGTPIENRLSELWSIFDFINKGYLGTMSDFQSKYAFNIEKMKQTDTAQKLQLVTSPFILRRLKTDKKIIDDLPEKIVFDEYCYLTPQQASLYESTLNSTMKLISDSTGINRRGMVLKLITSLKQICNHPANYLKNHDLTYDLSGKTKKIIAIMDNILQANEKVLIFTQYKEMGDILNKIIKEELHDKVLFFHGSLSRTEREDMIEKFQSDLETKVMILSLKAGGTGLNLTAATSVIHFDLWWNPAVEMQATDRTYRIGQDKNVTVHRLITLGTFEEKIDEILKSKQKLVDMSLYTGETMLGDLSDEEILEIFKLR
ncbi:MAG: DEAD/DEAH box helicase [Candidatus Gastranaerophilales bacterium]|nr:DEAD/DEAH box helicase [Candidatus Gastranaerophilales bacterium]